MLRSQLPVLCVTSGKASHVHSSPWALYKPMRVREGHAVPEPCWLALLVSLRSSSHVQAASGGVHHPAPPLVVCTSLWLHVGLPGLASKQGCR